MKRDLLAVVLIAVVGLCVLGAAGKRGRGPAPRVSKRGIGVMRSGTAAVAPENEELAKALLKAANGIKAEQSAQSAEQALKVRLDSVANLRKRGTDPDFMRRMLSPLAKEIGADRLIEEMKGRGVVITPDDFDASTQPAR